MKHPSPVRLCLRASLFLAFSLLSLQSQTVAHTPVPITDQITEVVDPSRLQGLPNHHPLWANPRNDLGLAASDLNLTLVLSRSPQQQSALQQLLADQKNPASPDFHHWLTPGEFGQRFGLSDNDLQAVKSWIESQGLAVNWVAPSRTFVGFGGRAATVGRAFSTTIHNYRVSGDQRTSVSSNPMIPAALAPVIRSVYGLYTIPDRPMHFVTAPQTAGPDLTASDGSHFIAPGDFQTIYDQGYNNGTGYQQSIGIVAQARTDPDDFTNFKQLTQSNFQTPTEIVPTAFGGVDPGPALTAPPSGTTTNIGEQLEATLDVTRAGSIAPSANLLIVVATAASGGIGVDAQYLVQTTPVPAQIMTISYGDCESDAGPAAVNQWDSLLQQAAAEGISVLVSSGDSGAAGCEPSFVSPVANPPAISPNYLCSSSYATCVGGTEFNDTTNSSAYWTNTGSNLASAIGYIPEGGWNEPTYFNGTTQLTQLASSGGGVSSVIPTPAWQTGAGVPAARAGRYTPDLSFTSSCHDAYFGCMAAAGGSCVVTNGSFHFIGLCGTSAAAPSMAGVAAMLNQKLQYSVGNLNPEIYAMGRNQPTSFRDTTPASSGVPCDINTPSMCNNSTPGPTSLTGGQAGYPVTVGYDLVTGWGSPDISQFLSNFASSLPAPTVTVTPSPTSINAGQPLTITLVVAGASGLPTPTGSVSLRWGTAAPLTAALTSGTATFSIAAGVLAGSAHPIIFNARYTPDPTSAPVYSVALGTCSVAITLLTPTVSMSFSPAAPTTAQDVVVTVSVSGGAGNPIPTGTVFIADVPNSGMLGIYQGTLSAGTVAIDIPAGLLPPGSDPFDVSYSPDNAGGLYYLGATASANLTVAPVPKATPSLTATLSATSVTLADTFTVTVKVAGTPGGPLPSGSVSVMVNGHSVSWLLTGGGALVSIPPGWLAVGSNTLSVNYPGDYDYSSATTTTAPITAIKVTPTVVVTPSVVSITTAQSLPVTIGVLGSNQIPSPTGTVTLTSGNDPPLSAPLSILTTITIPAGQLAAGTDTLTVNYSGDGTYTGATGTASVVVTLPPPPPPSFTVAATAVSLAPGATTGNTATITITPADGFTGSVSLTAALSSQPSGAMYLPDASFGSTSPVNITGTAAGTATLTITTTAPTSGALIPAPRPGTRWLPLGESALAGILLVGFRARRRACRSLLGSLLLLIAFSSALAACGGGGGAGSTPPPTPTPGTTPGTYSIAISAASGGITAATTLTLTVQ